MKKTKIPKNWVFVTLLILAVFLVGQLVKLLFEASSLYQWFRQVLQGS